MTTEEKRKHKQAEAEREASRIRALYCDVFNTEKGRAVLADLRQRFRLEEMVFTLCNKGDHAAYDPIKAALNDGARVPIMFILDQLKPQQPTEKPEVIK